MFDSKAVNFPSIYQETLEEINMVLSVDGEKPDDWMKHFKSGILSNFVILVYPGQ